jgi:GNAT superfamily N-acetyltransferase
MATEVSETDSTLEEMTSITLDPDMFKKLLALSISIFEPDKPEAERSQACQLSNWQELLSRPESILFYALNAVQHPIGFFFVESRIHPEVGYRLPHVWIACVDPKSRGLGLFPRLMEKTKAHATGLGYAEITVCTYPQRFTKMYRILCQNGWQKVCWLQEGEKVLMKLPL